jgi:hypothetical protein
MGYNYAGNEWVEFSELKGKVVTKVEGAEGNSQLDFYTNDGYKYSMYHEQDCCESVYIESIAGDLEDLVGEEILVAEESSGGVNPEDAEVSEYQESFTWTFYKLASRKGYVDIRWYGESNGYYSESVSVVKRKI